MIEMAAPLHDIGKIAIPDAVLMKPGPLTEEETAVMRRHPRIGHELLSGSQNRFIQAGALIALRHHERYDGSGYPDGLVGEEIPLEAQDRGGRRRVRRADLAASVQEGLGSRMRRWGTCTRSADACSIRAASTR